MVVFFGLDYTTGKYRSRCFFSRNREYMSKVNNSEHYLLVYFYTDSILIYKLNEFDDNVEVIYKMR